MACERLRPVDLARMHGLSAQAVRNYEEAGILPRAERTDHGYRVYTPLHAGALRAFVALVPGHGHNAAASIMRAVNDGAVEDALALIDKSHEQLLADRRTLAAVEQALRDLAPGDPSSDSPSGVSSGGQSGGQSGVSSSSAGPTPPGSPSSVPPDPSPRLVSPGGAQMFIGPLARSLGVRPATLRKWERAGLIRPVRDPRTGYRVYGPAAVRDARLAHQLRRGGYLLEQIAEVIEQVRAAGGLAPLRSTLADWSGRLSARGRSMLTGAAELDAYLRQRHDTSHPVAE